MARFNLAHGKACSMKRDGKAHDIARLMVKRQNELFC
jgi:hypothetical protein